MASHLIGQFCSFVVTPHCEGYVHFCKALDCSKKESILLRIAHAVYGIFEFLFPIFNQLFYLFDKSLFSFLQEKTVRPLALKRVSSTRFQQINTPAISATPALLTSSGSMPSMQNTSDTKVNKPVTPPERIVTVPSAAMAPIEPHFSLLQQRSVLGFLNIAAIASLAKDYFLSSFSSSSTSIRSNSISSIDLLSNSVASADHSLTQLAFSNDKWRQFFASRGNASLLPSSHTALVPSNFFDPPLLPTPAVFLPPANRLVSTCAIVAGLVVTSVVIYKVVNRWLNNKKTPTVLPPPIPISNPQQSVSAASLPLLSSSQNKIELLEKQVEEEACKVKNLAEKTLPFNEYIEAIRESQDKLDHIVKCLDELSAKDKSIFFSPLLQKIYQLRTKWQAKIKQQEERARALEAEKCQLLNGLPAPSDELLFHLHAEHFGKDSDLEGMSDRQMLAYVEEYMAKKVAQIPDPSTAKRYQSIAASLRQALEIAQISDKKMYINKMCSEIDRTFNAKPPASLLFPGGWVGTSKGHAIYYELVPEVSLNGQSLCTLRLYNLGAGSSLHGGIYTPSGKRKTFPCLEWRGIEREKLSSTAVLEAFYELTHCTQVPDVEDPKKTEYGVTDIYCSLKELLAPTSIGRPEHLHPKSDQEIGICAWKSLAAFLCSRLPHKEYKRLICDLKLQSLCNAVNDPSAAPSASRLVLLKQSLAYTAGYLKKQHKRGIISSLYLDKALPLLEELSEKVRQRQLVRSQSVPSAYLSVTRRNISRLTIPPLSYPSMSSLDAFSKSSAAPSRATSTYPITANTLKAMQEFRALGLPQATALSDQLSKLSNLMNSYWQTERFAVQQAAIAFISKVEVDKAYWQGIKEPRRQLVAKETIAALGEISKMFFGGCMASLSIDDNRYPEQVCFLGKLLSLQNEIATLAFGNAFPLFKDVQVRMYSAIGGFSLAGNTFALSNANDATALKEMLEEMIVKKGAFPLFVKEEISLDDCLEDMKKNVLHLSYYELIKTHEPDYFHSIESKSKGDHKKTMALLLTDPLLPKWLTALRNSHCYLAALLTSPNPDIRNLPTPSDLIVHAENKMDAKGEKEKLFFSIPLLGSYEPPIRMPWEHLYRCYNETSREIFLSSQKNGGLKESIIVAKREVPSSLKEKMPLSEFRAFARLFASNQIGLIDLIAYGKAHPFALEDSDMQTHILQLILNKAPKASIDAVNHCMAWLDSAYEFSASALSLRANAASGCAFILRMQRYLEQIRPHEGVRPPAAAVRIAQALERPLNAEQKSALYAELIASYGKENQALEEKELLLLTEGFCHLSRYPLADKDSDPLLLREIETSRLYCSQAIVTYFERNPQNAECVVRKLCPSLPLQSWRWEQGKLVSLASTFDPIHGDFVTTLSHSEEGVFLPVAICNHSDFRRLFPGVRKACRMGSTAEEIANAPYIFVDPSTGHLTRVSLSAYDNIIIEQQLQKGDPHSWHRYFCPQFFYFYDISYLNQEVTNCLINMSLTHNCSHWVSLEDQTLLIRDRTTHQLLYHCRKSKGGSYPCIEKIDAATQTSTTASRYLRPPTSPLCSVEHPAFIQEWVDSQGKLKDILLSRYNLSFSARQSPSYGKERLYCNEIPGFFLADGAEKKLSFLLSGYGQALLLQNEKGEEKVLIPHSCFRTVKSKEPLESLYDIDYQLWGKEEEGSLSYTVANVLPHGELETHNLPEESKLYLALLYAMRRDFEKSLTLLKQHNPSLRYDNPGAMRVILEQMCRITEISGGNDTATAALSTYAGLFWLKKNSELYPAPNSKEADEERARRLTRIQNSYERMVRKRQHLPLEILSTTDELFLLNKLPNLSPLLEHRKALLEGKDHSSSATWTPIHREPSMSRCELEWGVKGSDGYFFGLSKQQVKTEIEKWLFGSVTRKEDFRRYFVPLYELAMSKENSNKQWKERLEALLIFAKNDSLNYEVDFAKFLFAVLRQPDCFDPLPSLEDASWDKERNGAKWCKRQMATFQKLNQQPQAHATLPSAEGSPLLDQEPLIVMPRTIQPFSSLQVSQVLAFRAVKELVTNPEELFIAQAVPSSTATHALRPFLQTLSSYFKEPIAKGEAERLVKDLSAHEKNAATKRMTYGIKNEAALRSLLQEDSSTMAVLSQQEKEITGFANQLSSDPGQQQEQQLSRLHSQLSPLSLEELIVAFGRWDGTSLQQRNPALDFLKMAKLYEMVGNYLLLKTREQQRARARKLFAKREEAKTAEEKQLLAQELAQTLLAKRAYLIKAGQWQKTAAYLAFEYFGDLRMREDQVEKLDQFLGDSNPAIANPVMEMIMGSGKSTLLLPLLGLLRADGKCLSTLVVSERFYNDVSKQTDALLNRSFGYSLKTLHFGREMDLSSEALARTLKTLQEIRQQRECLIVTSKSMLCLQLNFLALWSSYCLKKDDSLLESLKGMSKILLEFRRHGHALIDEVDLVLNVMHDTSFSLGEKIALPQSSIDVTTSLYQILYGELAKEVAIDSDPRRSQVPLLTQALYQEKIKRRVADLFVQKKLPDLTPAIKESLIDYLCCDEKLSSERKKGAQQAFNVLAPEIKESMAFAREQISHFLEYTLLRKCNEHYGFDGQSLFVIPFAASEPTVGSEFAHPMVTLNLSIQAYINQGIPSELIHSQLKMLMEEASGNPSEVSSHLLAVSQKWGQRLGLSLDRLSDETDKEYIQKLADGINREKTMQWRLEFLQDFILPQLKFFPYKITGSSQNLVDLFARPSGFTGTLWNQATMHPRLTPVPEEGIESSTLELLWKHRNDGDLPIIEIEREKPEQIYSALKNVDVDLFIDAGGYCNCSNERNPQNFQVARQLASLKGKPTAFYHNGVQTITDGKREMPFKGSLLQPEERVTFLDQANATGANIPQKATAVAIVTIGREMMLRDLLQAVWRARGLAKGQRVRLMISKHVKETIRTTLHLANNQLIEWEEVIAFAIANQAKAQGRGNWRAFQQQINNVKQQLLSGILMDDKVTWSWKRNMFIEQQEVLVSAESLLSLRLPSQEQSPQEIIEQCCNEAIQWINSEYSSALPSELKQAIQEIERIRNRFKDPALLPANIDGFSATGLTVEVAKETRKETHKELAVEMEQSKHTGCLPRLKGQQLRAEKFDIGRICALKRNRESTSSKGLVAGDGIIPCYPLDECMSSLAEYRFYTKAFADLFVSLNFLDYTGQPSASSTAASSSMSLDYFLYGPDQKEFDYLLFRGGKVILLSQEDADEDPSLKIDTGLYSLKAGLFCNDFANNEKKQVDANYLPLLVKAKFLAGALHYSKAELAFLKKWLASNDAVALRLLFEEKAIARSKKLQNSYQQSELKKLFDTLAS